ncbi:glycosyltransferase family 2 protein [Bacteroides thetaiotaomicron]|nr:glycosyltransferase family 2 protein [Bacteroides thetaiotaomicron]
MITVFTPTYNRGYIIQQLYDSLILQSYKNFEWLVIDDGSTDDTEELFKSFIAERKIKIHYSKVKNGGKHRAINKGLELARGNFFLLLIVMIICLVMHLNELVFLLNRLRVRTL